LLFANKSGLPIGSRINILDFGGACGLTFFIAQYLLPNFSVKCIVVETSEMVMYNNQRKTHPDLSFISNVNEISNLSFKPDIIMCGSSLQYTQNPCETLRELLTFSPSVCSINRIPLSELKYSQKLIQKSNIKTNGPTIYKSNMFSKKIYYPLTVDPLHKIQELLDSHFKTIRIYKDGVLNHKNLTEKSVYSYSFWCS
jgi:putative methyltransferase (TIGR04325 family)